MMHASMLCTSITTVAAALLCCAALHDLATRTIPDRVTLAVATLGAVEAAVRDTVASSALTAATVFALLVLAWRGGLLGGGDVKLIPATTLLVPPAAVPALLATITMAGGVVALFYLVLRRLVRCGTNMRVRHAAQLPGRIMRAEFWRIRRHAPIPYAVAIAAGMLLRVGNN